MDCDFLDEEEEYYVPMQKATADVTPAKEMDFSQLSLNQCENCLLVLASPWGLKRHRLKCVGKSAVKSVVESKA